MANSKRKANQSIEDYADDDCPLHGRSSNRVRSDCRAFDGQWPLLLTLALKHPQKVNALALFGSGAKLRVAPLILENIANPETFTEAVEQVNRACFSPHASSDLIALLEKRHAETDPATLLQDFLACNQFDVTDQLANIHVPTLILCGAEDAMTPPKYSQYLKDNLPNAQLHILEKAGHMLTLEQPEAVAKILMKQFLDELPPHS